MIWLFQYHTLYQPSTNIILEQNSMGLYWCVRLVYTDVILNKKHMKFSMNIYTLSMSFWYGGSILRSSVFK